MISERLKNFLDRKNVRYEIVRHARKMTAQEIAAEEHVSGRKVAKAVILKGRSGWLMAVTPASRGVDLTKLRRLVGDPGLRLAEESEFRALFPDCELGAMPPFGNLYGMPCWADLDLRHPPDLFFNGGNLEESVKIRTADYERLSQAAFGDIAARKPLRSAV